MKSPSRRTLLTAAAAMAAASPALAAQDTGFDGGDAPVFPSRAAAARARLPAGAVALLCAGFARAGDGGEAIYMRVGEEPPHSGKFRSADGAWWELAERELNPLQFGAMADGRTDDSAAIQAMFDFVAAKRVAYPMRFLGGRYMVRTGLTLPSVPATTALDIDGGGAILRTDRAITILSRVPRDQEEAMRVIVASRYDIHHFEFRGSGAPGQTGLHLGASYGSVIRNCAFNFLDYGSIGSFCLQSVWRDNQYQGCAKRAALVQSGAGSDQGAVWPGAAESNSASNVSVFENCHVFGHRDQISAFGIFGSDTVRLVSCISEGHGANYDVEYDYQGSPTSKLFHIDTFHCEAQAKVNFRIRASGKVTIERVARSLPSALFDASGSMNCEIIVRGIAWLGEMPEARADGPNPRGRWFYHSDGNGFGAAAERGVSSGTSYRFEDMVEGAWRHIANPARWEGGKLPEGLFVRGRGKTVDGDEGMVEWSNAPIVFASPVSFSDRNSFGGMKTGVVLSAACVVPPHSGFTQRVRIDGLISGKHFLFVNPANGDSAPPAGIAWNGFIAAENMIELRYTNATDRPVSLGPADWAWCAMLRG
jgi:hypothetical protein